MVTSAKNLKFGSQHLHWVAHICLYLPAPEDPKLSFDFCRHWHTHVRTHTLTHIKQRTMREDGNDNVKRTQTCELSPIWLPKHDPNKDDTSKPANMDGEKHMRYQS